MLEVDFLFSLIFQHRLHFRLLIINIFNIFDSSELIKCFSNVEIAIAFMLAEMKKANRKYAKQRRDIHIYLDKTTRTFVIIQDLVFFINLSKSTLIT